MPNSVRYYDSTMSGAPSLSGTAGALIGVLDACLVDGFGSVTVDSLVVASNVATATVSAGHQFAMVGNTGPVLRIAGASPSGLNGDWRVTVTSATTFTFLTTGIADQTATGTLTAKRAPAGFSKAFSGTNLAAYRADDVQSTRLYLRVNDAGNTYARVCGYEVMTDVSTGTGLFPSAAQISGGGYVSKSNAESSASRGWAVYSDGRIIYVFINYDNLSWHHGFVFGDISSYVANDSFGCALIAGGYAGEAFPLFNINGDTSGSFIARNCLQIGGSITSCRYSHRKTTALGYDGQLYPGVAGNSLLLWPVECWEGTGNARGLMPGLWNPIHNSNPAHGLVFEAIPNLPGRSLVIQMIYSSNRAAMDITGPWR